MKLTPIAAIVLASLLILFTPARGQAAETKEGDVSFAKNLELLEAQLRLRVLEQLYSRGFYVPRPIFDDYFQAQQKVAAELQEAQLQDLRTMADWAKEERKIEAAENLEMQKLATRFAKTLVKEGVLADAALRAFEKEMQSMDQCGRLRNLAAARYIEEWGQLPGPGGKKASPSARGKVIDSIRHLYRESDIQRTDKLVRSVLQLQRQRRATEATLQVLLGMQRAMTWMDNAQDPARAAKRQIDETLKAYLAEHGSDRLDPESVAKITSAIKRMGEGAYAASEKLKELDNDRVMNPTVRKAACQWAILSSVYSSTLGIAKDLDERTPDVPFIGSAELRGPLFAVLDFYGDAIKLIPTVAQKMSVTFAKVDQSYEGRAGLGEFAKIPSYVGLWSVTSAGRHFNLPIGFELGNDEWKTDKVTLVLDAKTDPADCATLTVEQYERIARALADERLVNAPAEARAATPKWSPSAIGETITSPDLAQENRRNVLEPDASAAYLKTLKSKAMTTPLTPAKLVEIVNDPNEEWRDTENDREYAIDLLSKELACREALGADFTNKHLELWDSYIETLRKANVPLTPTQIIKLFNFYAKGDANREHLADSLAKLRTERLAKLRPAPKLGVCEVSFNPDVPKPKTTVEITATVIVSNLAPGETRDFSLTWTLPRWAGSAPATRTVQLSNGSNVVRHSFTTDKEITADGNVGLKLVLANQPAGEQPIGVQRRVTYEPESKLLVWVRDEAPILNPARLSGRSAYDNPNDTHNDRPNHHTRNETIDRGETSVSYRYHSTNTHRALVKRQQWQCTVSWTPPAKVLRPGEKAQLLVQPMTGTSVSGDLNNGVPYYKLGDLRFGMQEAYVPGKDVGGENKSAMLRGGDDFKTAQTLEVATAVPNLEKSEPVMALYVRFEEMGEDFTEGTVVVWPYRLKKVTREELVALLESAGQKPMQAPPPPIADLGKK